MCPSRQGNGTAPAPLVNTGERIVTIGSCSVRYLPFPIWTVRHLDKGTRLYIRSHAWRLWVGSARGPRTTFLFRRTFFLYACQKGNRSCFVVHFDIKDFRWLFCKDTRLLECAAQVLIWQMKVGVWWLQRFLGSIYIQNTVSSSHLST